MNLFQLLKNKGQSFAPVPAPAALPVSVMLGTARSPLGDEIRDTPFAEIRRITSLPMRRRMSDAEVLAYSLQHITARKFDEGFRFFRNQAEALQTYEQSKCLFAPIGVGWGKTLISLGIAQRAITQLNYRKVMLFVPSNVASQLTETDIAMARSHIGFNIPIINMAAQSKAGRLMAAKSNRRGLYINTYSLLSATDADDVLDAIKPDCIILDEAHNVRGKSARTRRLSAYIEKNNPSVNAMSGTMTSRSIKDYAHIANWCLGDGTPLPRAAAILDAWAGVIDAESTGTHGNLTSIAQSADSPLMPLLTWAKENVTACITCDGLGHVADEENPEHPRVQCPKCKGSCREAFTNTVSEFRRAFLVRMSTTPGVVSSGDSEIKCSLEIDLLQSEQLDAVSEPSQESRRTLNGLMKQVDEEWLTPNNDEIDYAIHKWKWLDELTAGFYNKLAWPTEGTLARRRNIELDQAADIIYRAKEHHTAQQSYHKSLRKYLETKARAGLDTPFLIGSSMHQHGAAEVGTDMYETWQYMKSKDFAGRPERDGEAIRVCDYKVQLAAYWASCLRDEHKRGGVIWYYHQEMGFWLQETLQAYGIESLHCPAGEANNMRILQALPGQLVIASYKAHGTGKNLQKWNRNLFLQWPRSAQQAEQILGRMHRNGQEEDEVVSELIAANDFDELTLAACLNDACYIHETMGSRQKLVYGRWKTIPKLFPHHVLLQRGLDPRARSTAVERRLREKFLYGESQK